MDPAARSLRLIASHQDQVVELPAGAEVIARSDHCPIAAYTVGPTALAIQPHPEFTAPLSRGLVVRRRAAIGPERADGALDTLDGPLDRELVARWMAGFLRTAARR
jgi:GMP synthase (glutamine-hydrolysing)